MKNKIKILSVESDAEFGKKLSYFLNTNPDFEVTRLNNGKSCLDNLKSYPSLITIAYNLPDMTGLELLKKIKSSIPEMPVIVISEQNSIESAIELLNNGAEEYIVKNEKCIDNLFITIKKMIDAGKIYRNVPGSKMSGFDLHELIIGESEAMQKVFRLIEKSSNTNVNISVYGETGSGKELLARAIHDRSSFKNGQFVVVNCNTLSKELLESELFGHEKGAFTGAIEQRKGRFEEAQNGTIFLDEIGDLDIKLQARLLRVLQEKVITRIGGNIPVKINVRLIVASTKNLKDEIKKRNFREDLYYRLLGLPIYLPPLRDRGYDIILLAKHFLKLTAKENKSETYDLAVSAEEMLLKHAWYGNVRELKSTIQRAALMTIDRTITNRNLEFDTISPGGGLLLTEELTMEEYRYKILHQFLQKYKNPDLVAEKLKLGRATVFRMLKNMKQR